MARFAGRTAGEAGLSRQAIGLTTVAIVAVAVIASLVFTQLAISATRRRGCCGVTGRAISRWIAADVQRRATCARVVRGAVGAATTARNGSISAATRAQTAVCLNASGAAREQATDDTEHQSAKLNDPPTHRSTLQPAQLCARLPRAFAANREPLFIGFKIAPQAHGQGASCRLPKTKEGPLSEAFLCSSRHFVVIGRLTHCDDGDREARRPRRAPRATREPLSARAFHSWSSPRQHRLCH